MDKQEILLAHKERASSIIPNMRKRLKRCSFSIISNTCLGTYLYKDLDIPYIFCLLTFLSFVPTYLFIYH